MRPSILTILLIGLVCGHIFESSAPFLYSYFLAALVAILWNLWNNLEILI